jgi:hypothetical protein
MAAGLRRRTTRGLEVLRAEGLGGIRLRALDATIYRRLNVYARSLAIPLPDGEPAADAEYSLLGADEVAAYRELRPDTPAVEVERRLDAGHWCMVARLDGSVVHARWVSPHQLESAHLGFAFDLPASTIYSYDFYTAVRARRLGIGAEAVRRYNAILERDGARIVLGCVWPGNRVAIEMLAKQGQRPIGSLGSLRLGPFRRPLRHRLQEGYVGEAHRFSPPSGRR